jgi:hypothetical protein
MGDIPIRAQVLPCLAVGTSPVRRATPRPGSLSEKAPVLDFGSLA